MGVEAFYELTPRQLANIAKGYDDKEQRLFRERWERSRWIAYWAASVNLRKGTQPRQLITFPWEEEQLQELSLHDTDQIKKDIEKSKALWKKIDNKHDKTYH